MQGLNPSPIHWWEKSHCTQRLWASCCAIAQESSSCGVLSVRANWLFFFELKCGIWIHSCSAPAMLFPWAFCGCANPWTYWGFSSGKPVGGVWSTSFFHINAFSKPWTTGFSSQRLNLALLILSTPVRQGAVTAWYRLPLRWLEGTFGYNMFLSPLPVFLLLKSSCVEGLLIQQRGGLVL